MEDLASETIKLADIGAAFFAETPPYQPLLDRGLARLFAFEPDPRETENLRKHLGKSGQVVPYAVGDGKTHTFYSCPPTSGMSSLLEPDPQALAFFNKFPLFGAIQSTSPMDTRRLDDIDEIDEIDFLKMDVQGAELMVLQNGRKKLSDCVVVQTEVSFIALYKNQPSFGDIDLELRSQNLIPHCFPAIKKWPISPAVRDNDERAPFNQLLEADIVYIRDIIHPDTMNDAQLRKLATIAHYVYYSYDLVIRCIVELQNRKACGDNALADYMSSRELPFHL